MKKKKHLGKGKEPQGTGVKNQKDDQRKGGVWSRTADKGETSGNRRLRRVA